MSDESFLFLTRLAWTDYLFGMVLCGVVGYMVGQKRKRPGAGAVMGFLLGPIGWAITYFGPDNSRKCGQCGGAVPDAGVAKCMHCGSDLPPTYRVS